jgi:Post-segregation antitoxin CcdA
MEETSLPEKMAEQEKISIQIDSALLEQLRHLTNDPSRIIEAAIKQWLRGERDQDNELSRTFRKNPTVPPRGEWND